MAACVKTYDIGDLVILRNGTFKDGSDTAVDPPVITVKVQNPLRESISYTYGVDANVEKLAVGVYRCTIKPLLSGIWFYRWQAQDPAASITVALEGAEEHSFHIRSSAFTY